MGIEEPKIKQVETEDMSVDLPVEVSNAEYSDGEEQESSVPVVESEEFTPVEEDDDITFDSEQSNETSESTIDQEEQYQEEEAPKKLGKFNPDLVFTLTHTKTGGVIEVIGGINYAVDKLLDMGLKASASGFTNAVAGRTGSHCGFVITSNQPQKKVKKTKKSKKAVKKSTKKKSKKKTGKKSTKKSKKKTGKKAAKKVQPKKKTGK